ncbi:MAG TPA: hypothetical protein VFP60_00455 [Pseudolabrys sp.]|nr:hypothetical protein [Pseudolabrys sp.]
MTVAGIFIVLAAWLALVWYFDADGFRTSKRTDNEKRMRRRVIRYY